MERIREICVTVEVETNKRTLRRRLAVEDGESLFDLAYRVRLALDELDSPEWKAA